jgi:adenosylcobinamide hydrolase
MVHLCIIRYDNIIVFITAGITHPDIGRDNEAGPVRTDNSPGTINIICCVEEGMSDQGLLDAIISVTEAKALALAGLGHEFAGTVTDAVIIASEGEGKLQYTGCATSLGLKIHKAVLFGVPKALEMSSRKGTSDTHFEQVFFIYSTISGNRWIEWSKGNCPYYPCHFKGQMCDFCFCPLYPCKDETLGEWTRSSQREGKVWNCAPCTLNHQPAVVRHLRANPQATLLELKSFLKNQDICRNKLT